MLLPVTCILGAFGSGKTEVAINLALAAAAGGRRVALVDLDTVTPAFRTRQATGRLQRAGVRVIAPSGPLAYADLPALPPEVRAALDHPEQLAVLDVGGGPTGARALGSLADLVRRRRHHCWVVVNPWRPGTRRQPDVEATVRAVTAAAGMEPTGLVPNLHVPPGAGLQEVRDGVRMVEAAGAALGLPLALGACRADADAAELAAAAGPPGFMWMRLELHMRAPWEEAGLPAVPANLTPSCDDFVDPRGG